MHKATHAYMQTQVTTTTQGDLLIMIFDAGLKYLKQAKEEMAAKNYAKKGILISKALDVLAELQSSLNAQKGGELAENLQKLYLLCSTKLLMANLHMNQELVDQVINIMSGVRDAFAQINTPELVPTQQAPVQANRYATGTVPIAGTMTPQPSAMPTHRAFAAYATAGKGRAAG